MGLQTQIFWPKEIKELVAQYRAQGGVNERAITNINKRIRKIVVSYAVVFAIVYWSLCYIAPTLSAFIFPVFLVLASYEIRRFFTINVETVNLGSMAHGKLLSIEKKGFGYAEAGWLVHYSLKDSRIIDDKLLWLFEDDDCSFEYKAGDDIRIYLHPHNQKASIPAFQEVVSKYTLKEQNA